MKRSIVFLFILTLGITACNASTPTPAILADSFFSGYAYLDANGNGQLDSADTPLKDAIFIVRLESGAEFGANTDEKGNAFVTIPGGAQYPVTLFMKPPKDSALILIGPQSIVLDQATKDIQRFLFKAK